MTNDILESDIELARTRLAAGRPEEEIVGILQLRGVDHQQAWELVLCLREGLHVAAPMPLAQRIAPIPRQTPEFPQPQQTADDEGSTTIVRSVSESATPRPGPSQSRDESTRPRRSGLVWGLVFGVCAGVIATWLVISLQLYQPLQRLLPETTVSASRLPEIPASPANSSSPQLALRTPADLDLGAEGLEVCGKTVDKQNVMAVLEECLGGPTRTNQISDPPQTVYAYDQAGVLVYCRPGGGDEILVVDFQARGGDHGARNAFAGNLRIGGVPIAADTDAKTLAAIQGLSLSRPSQDASVFGGQYRSLEMFFAYLKNSSRLDLVEINLK